MVSILVFLEWPLGHNSAHGLGCQINSFNPCFSGMAFGTLNDPDMAEPFVMFQSLFFWNGLWDPKLLDARRCQIHGFNPCFSGMAFGTIAAARVCLPGIIVSILVFLEWPLGRNTASSGLR